MNKNNIEISLREWDPGNGAENEGFDANMTLKLSFSETLRAVL